MPPPEGTRREGRTRARRSGVLACRGPHPGPPILSGASALSPAPPLVANAAFDADLVKLRAKRPCDTAERPKSKGRRNGTTVLFFVPSETIDKCSRLFGASDRWVWDSALLSPDTYPPSSQRGGIRLWVSSVLHCVPSPRKQHPFAHPFRHPFAQPFTHPFTHLGGVFAQHAHSAGTAPIITVIIQVTTLKTTHLLNHAQSIQNSKIQTSDACHGSQGPKFCPL